MPFALFTLAVLALLAVDLGVFHRTAEVVSVKNAAVSSAVWVALALAFAGGVFVFMGRRAGTEFVAGYLLEYSLSVDNIFLMVLAFSYFGIARELQHRVLFWGIIGALAMRGVMVAAGAALITQFAWVSYVFGIFLVITGVRMGVQHHKQVNPENNVVLRLVKRFVPFCDECEGERFFVTRNDAAGIARRMATPLFVVLVVIETMDLAFAVDSIPAVFGVTRNSFIVYTSNIAAILGLRSLYFLLAGAVEKLRYLRYALAVILTFVGAKMLVAPFYEIDTLVSLAVIISVLAIAAAASVWATRRDVSAARSAA